MTPQELQLLTDNIVNAIEKGIKSGFDTKDMRAFDASGNPIQKPGPDASKDEWNDFLKAANIQSASERKTAHEEDILRQMEAIRTGNHRDSELARKKLDELTNELERSQNGGISQKDVNDAKQDAKVKKWNKAVSKATAAVAVVKAIGEVIIANERRKLAIANAQIDYNEKVAEYNIKRQSALASLGMKIMTGGFTRNANELAYDIVSSSYDISKTSVMTANELKIAGQTYQKEITKANLEFAGACIGTCAAAGAAIGACFGGIGAPIGALVGVVVGAVASLFSDAAEVAIQKRELAIKETEVAAKITEGYMNTFQQLTAPFDQLYTQTSNFVLTINDAAKDYGATIGYTGDKFANTVLAVTQRTVTGGETLVKLFGKESEKMHEYMANYATVSGRNVGLTAEDYGNLMGTSRLFGISGAESTQLYGSMNIFNTSISSASDSMGVMYHQLTRMGLSSKRFGKELVQNLKLAEKYNFKGGVENLMKMTKWSLQTRFNLKNATNFADSLMNGSLSDVLEQSAKLQVLGGSAAMYSDPFGLMYDAWNDTGNLAQRMASMFKDLPGTFNSETGEVEYKGYTRQMVAARAKAMGMDVGEALNYLRQNDKQGRINQVLSGYDVSEEDKVALANRATWDKENQRWVVVDDNGKQHDITDYASGKADINDLLPVETDKAILEVVKDALSELKKLNGAQESNLTKLGIEEQSSIFDTVRQQRTELENFYKNNWYEIKQGFDAAREQSKTLFSTNIEIMKKLGENVYILRQIYSGMANNMGNLVGSENFEKLERHARAFADGYLTEYIHDYTASDLTEDEDDGFGNLNGGILKGVTNTKSIKDGIGKTNGGYILNSSNVKSINDGSVNVKTANSDQYLAAMPNGPIDKILQQLIPGLQALLTNKGNYNHNTQSNNVNIDINGKLMLSQDGSTINLVEIMKNDTAMANQFIRVLQRAMESNQNGRPTHNYMV